MLVRRAQAAGSIPHGAAFGTSQKVGTGKMFVLPQKFALPQSLGTEVGMVTCGHLSVSCSSFPPLVLAVDWSRVCHRFSPRSDPE